MDSKEKRKRVMTRSIKLGHCVCDPRKPCPCPLFEEQNVCSCAGERVPPDGTGEQVRLTKFVRSAGCASKIGQKELHKVLDLLPVVQDSRLLVGTATADDAGVFRLTDDVTIVQTVDVFTPGVDDPYLFGRIAGCNSLSDVYAMGGTPVTALSVIGFPIYSLPHEVMAEILRGGMDVLDEAGAVLLGGHSINDEEIKFGFAVTGVIDAADLVTNAGAKEGDVLILTKPLGTGIVSLANQIGKASAEAVEAIGESMSTLNRSAAEIMVRHGATACTDITGFGLLGHLCQMVLESGVTAEIWCNRLPLFPGVNDYAGQGIYSGANERNADYSVERTQFGEEISEAQKAVLFDAQTSGGLLIAAAPEAADRMLREMHAAGVCHAVVIGRIIGVSSGQIQVSANGESAVASSPTEQEVSISGKDEAPEVACCAGTVSEGGNPMALFQEHLSKSMQPGALDVVTKELIAVALSLGVQCEPCSRIHIKKALGMGIGRAEIEEVAALAVGFGGCKTMVLWDELKEDIPQG